MNLITAHKGTEHITSANIGVENVNYFGPGNYVFRGRGREFEANLQNNNKVRIYSGEGMMNGRHFEMVEAYEDITINSGAQLSYRNDLICIRYTMDLSTGIENAELVVIEGQTRQDAAVDPTYNSAPITDGASVYDMPLYRVTIEGVQNVTLTQLFDVVGPIGERIAETETKVKEEVAKYEQFKNDTTAKVDELETTFNTSAESAKGYAEAAARSAAQAEAFTPAGYNELVDNVLDLGNNVTEINANLKAEDDLEFRFATDGEGNYGYLGADDSFIPFKRGEEKSNPNLLDNGWFNADSRGVTSWGGTHAEYGLDRWIAWGTNSIITVNADSITVNSTAIYNGIAQLIDADKLKINNVYTCSIMLEDNSIKSATFTEKKVNGVWQLIRQMSENLYITHFYNESTKQFYFVIDATKDNVSFTIKAVKLEEGTESTLHLDTVPDYGRTLLKCINSHADSNDEYANKAIGNPKTGNWITNPNFLVNQKGATTYTGAGVTANCWLNYINGANVVVDNGITLSETISGDASYNALLLRQKFPLTLKGTYTLTVDIESISGNWLVVFGGNHYVDEAGIKTFTITTDNLTKVDIYHNRSSEGTIKIKGIKLEIGETSTYDEDTADYGWDLWQCKRYYCMFGKDLAQYEVVDKGATVNSYYTDFKIPLERPLYKTPTYDANYSSPYGNWCIEYYSDGTRQVCNAVPTVQSMTDEYVVLRFSHPNISTNYSLRLLEPYVANSGIGLNAEFEL